MNTRLEKEQEGADGEVQREERGGRNDVTTVSKIKEREGGLY